MDKQSLADLAVGTEVSVMHEGHRRKGWVAEQEKNTIIRLYPQSGENGDFEIDDPRQLKVLKRQTIPKGWNAVELLKEEDNTPWISLRFDDHFWEMLHKQAEDKNKTPEEMFNQYILDGLARYEEEN